MEQQQGQLQQQSLQPRAEKKQCRLGTGLFKSSSSLQRTMNKTYVPLFEQNNGNLTAQNYFVSPTSQPLLQISEPGSQCNGFQTQSGFFKRKIQVKMNTTGLKAFSSKPQGESLAVFSAKKAKFSPNPQNQFNTISNSLQSSVVQGHSIQTNTLNSQHPFSLPISGLKNESSTFHSAFSQWSNNNQDLRRSLVSPSELLTSQGSTRGLKSGFVGSFHRARIIPVTDQKKEGEVSQLPKEDICKSEQEEKKEQLISQQQQQSKDIQNKDGNSQQNENTETVNEESDSRDDSHGVQCSSMQGNNANYSHNTESTNVTSAQSQSVSQHLFLDASNSKVKSPVAGRNPQFIYTKKKIQEAQQYSNQVRQQIFERQDQEEEEDFLKLCETLQNISSN